MLRLSVCFLKRKSFIERVKWLSTSTSSQHGGVHSKRLHGPEVRIADTLIHETKRYEPKHEEVLREKARPEALLNASLLEEEFRAEMAVVLGRIDSRLREKLKLVEVANEKVTKVLSKAPRDVDALEAAVKEFNSAHDAAYEARLDLIIQRQSTGFWLNNHTVIMNRYPIPPKKKVRRH